jgi:hypothetical protein
MSRLARSSGFGSLVLLAALLPALAQARPAPIDDSGSSVLEPLVALRWQHTTPMRGAGEDLMVGTMTVRLRLNVLAWMHRTVRIYLVLPPQPPGPLQASWSAQDRLSPGQVRSGERALVYAGPISSALLEDTLRFEVSIDARRVERAFPLTLQFEAEST